MKKTLSNKERRIVKHKKDVAEAIKHIKYVDEDILLEVSDALSKASNKYFYKRDIIGENTIKLILYKDILGECDWIKEIVASIYSLDDVRIDPFDRKLSKGYIDTCMFTPYIDCEEIDKIKKIYKMCIEGIYPKIRNFNKNMSMYVKKLKDIYKRYVDEVIPLLADTKTHSLKEYNMIIRTIFAKHRRKIKLTKKLRELGYDEEALELQILTEEAKEKGLIKKGKGCEEYDGALERYLDTLPDDDPIFK